MIELKLTEKQYECLIGILSQLEKNHSVTTECITNNDVLIITAFYNVVCESIEQIRLDLSKTNLPEFIRKLYTNLLEYYLKQKKEIVDYARKNLCN